MKYESFFKAGVSGMDVSAIFEDAFNKGKSFDPKEIADSIEFLTEEGYIYKLGIGKVQEYFLNATQNDKNLNQEKKLKNVCITSTRKTGLLRLRRQSRLRTGRRIKTRRLSHKKDWPTFKRGMISTVE